MGSITIGVVFAWIVLGVLAYLAIRGLKRLFALGKRKAGGRSMHTLNRIEKLAALRDGGAISEAEYESEKAKLLS